MDLCPWRQVNVAFSDWASAEHSTLTHLAPLLATAEAEGLLAADGLLHRGLRAILAHHIIFAWNRHGLPYPTQAILANTAKAVVFGRDPTANHQTEQEGQQWTASAGS
ncbi:MAG: hypothetical protein ACT4NY_14950 [Pseudonocardiales bacterium]